MGGEAPLIADNGPQKRGETHPDIVRPDPLLAADKQSTPFPDNGPWDDVPLGGEAATEEENEVVAEKHEKCAGSLRHSGSGCLRSRLQLYAGRATAVSR